MKDQRRTDVSCEEVLSLREHVAAVLFMTNWILLTSTTIYETTPAIHFQEKLSTSMRRASGSSNFRATTRGVPWLSATRLTVGLAPDIPIELVSCEKEREQAKESEATIQI